MRIAPLEEIIWQKAYITERERFDGADIAHLQLKCAHKIDWEHLLERRLWGTAARHVLELAFISQMESSQSLRIKEDLRSQAYEGCRKILASVTKMIASPSAWQRDAFYDETMRHLAMLQQQLGQWRLKVARLQSDAIASDGGSLDRPQ